MLKFKSFTKGVIFSFIFFSLFFAFPKNSLCLAETNNLGNFSNTEISAKFQNELILKAASATYTLSPTEIATWLKSQESLFYNPQYLSEIENINFCTYKKSTLCQLSFSFANRQHIQKISSLSVDRELLKKSLDDLARQINRDPIDAKLQFEEGKVSAFSLSQNGIALDQEKSLEIIINYFKKGELKKELELAYNEIKPSIATDSIDNLGITTLIGEGRSNFKGSPKNRIFNINVATSRFNGVLIKPGEEFSFVKALGEVDGEHGYLPELVIKNNVTEPEFGGGICQVSTTAFRAAIYSGLKITARKNHAYPVSYYNPQGMDSTVYIPRPDLRFINNTPRHILIQTKIEGTELIFQFYGTSDGRRINVIGPKITERNSDGSMKATFTQEVFDKNDNYLINDVFNSSYNSPDRYPHPGQVLTQKPADWSEKEWREYKKNNKP